MPGSALIHPPIDEIQVWPDLPIGTTLDVIKVGFDGSVKASYPGTVVDAGAPAPWIAVECHWTLPGGVSSGLHLVTGDSLIEFYSPEHAYNAFRIHAPDGTLRGWYANVTYPTIVEGTTLAWHDLWLDLIVLAGGSFVVEDRDELEAAGISQSDPALYAAILESGDELIRLATERSFPFNAP